MTALKSPSVVEDIKVGGRAFESTVIRREKLYLSAFVLQL